MKLFLMKVIGVVLAVYTGSGTNRGEKWHPADDWQAALGDGRNLGRRTQGVASADPGPTPGVASAGPGWEGTQWRDSAGLELR